MQPYSPWQSPPNTGTLEMGDLASFEINGLDAETGEAEAPETEDSAEAAPMVAAMQVLNQQSQIINKLLDMLSSKKGN